MAGGQQGDNWDMERQVAAPDIHILYYIHPPVLNENENVSSLINSQSGKWHTYMLLQLFSSDGCLGIDQCELILPKGTVVHYSKCFKVVMASSPNSDSGAPSNCQKRSMFWKTVWGSMFQTRSRLSFDELAKTYCPLRLTSTIVGSLTILSVMLADWRLRLVGMLKVQICVKTQDLVQTSK